MNIKIKTEVFPKVMNVILKLYAFAILGCYGFPWLYTENFKGIKDNYIYSFAMVLFVLYFTSKIVYALSRTARKLLAFQIILLGCMHFTVLMAILFTICEVANLYIAAGVFSVWLFVALAVLKDYNHLNTYYDSLIKENVISNSVFKFHSYSSVDFFEDKGIYINVARIYKGFCKVYVVVGLLVMTYSVKKFGFNTPEWLGDMLLNYTLSLFIPTLMLGLSFKGIYGSVLDYMSVARWEKNNSSTCGFEK